MTHTLLLPRGASVPARLTGALMLSVTGLLAGAFQMADPAGSGQGSTASTARPAHAAVAVNTDSSTLTLGLPATGPGRRTGATTLFGGSGAGYDVVVRRMSSSLRAMVHLRGHRAPERYAFPITGAAGMRLDPTGAVTLLDAARKPVGVISAPWARDARGRAVATWFEVEGGTLVQIVRHRNAHVAYPVVADPSIWSMLKCAGSMLAAVVSVVIPGSKLLQLKRFVKAVGGIKDAARLLLQATTKAEKLKAIRSAVGPKAMGATAAALLSIPGIRDNCF